MHGIADRESELLERLLSNVGDQVTERTVQRDYQPLDASRVADRLRHFESSVGSQCRSDPGPRLAACEMRADGRVDVAPVKSRGGRATEQPARIADLPNPGHAIAFGHKAHQAVVRQHKILSLSCLQDDRLAARPDARIDYGHENRSGRI